MTMSSTNPKRRVRSQAPDLVGALAAHLRDLTGYSTLASELIQNADDAPDATWISFDVTADALIVQNDGVFTSCDSADNPSSECTMATDGSGKCDVHSFLAYAGQAKREKDGTTGAFGVGFTVVYQLTDRPELISGDIHWILRPDANISENVEECLGCDRCRSVEGTLIRLPWASEDSQLRQRLGMPPVDSDVCTHLVEDLAEALPHAVLFLKRLQTVTLARNGRSVMRVRVQRDDGTIVISIGQQAHRFCILSSDFASAADSLRERFTAIEPKRRCDVRVAIPMQNGIEVGVAYATLPTSEQTGLPFSFDADFFPRSDRKSIVLDDGYQADWNRAAVDACAAAVAENLERLADELGYERVWELVATTYDAYERATDPRTKDVLERFWNAIVAGSAEREIVLSADGQSYTPAEVVLLRKGSDYPAALVRLLTALPVHVLSQKLVGHVRKVPFGDLGIAELDLDRWVRELRTLGLGENCATAGDIPLPLRDQGSLNALWDELEALLEGESGEAEAVEALKRVAVLPEAGGGLFRSDSLSDPGDEETQIALSPYMRLLDTRVIGERPRLRKLVERVGFESAVEALEGRESIKTADAVLAWFARRSDEIGSDEDLRERIASLPIFRSSTGEYLPLTKLNLAAASFNDPAGVARLVDDGVAAAYRVFLKELGVAELDLKQYVTEQLPWRLETGDNASEWATAVLEILAAHHDELRRLDLREALEGLAIVPGSDGELHAGTDLYFDNGAARRLFGDFAQYVAWTCSTPRCTELLALMGVKGDPRPEHVIEFVRSVVAESPSPARIDQIKEVLRYLAQSFPSTAARGSSEDVALQGRFNHEYGDLKRLEWLPSRRDKSRWFAPPRLLTPSVVHLVGSKADVLDGPQVSRVVMLGLGLTAQPDVESVVEHLLDSARRTQPVKGHLFDWLAQHRDSPALKDLEDKPCLLVDGRYRSPREVFWSQHPFGGWRVTLGDECHKWKELLDTLGVREAPEYADAVEVLREAADAKGGQDVRGSETENVVWSCWRLIANELANDRVQRCDVRQDLGQLPCIIGGNGLLARPVDVLVDDVPSLPDGFRSKLGPRLIERTTEAFEAQRAAGVRSLRIALVKETRFRGKAVVAKERVRELRTRQRLIARCVASSVGEDAAQLAIERLRKLDVRTAVGLEARWVLPGDADRIEGPWEPTHAALDMQEGCLYISSRSPGSEGLTAQAHELAAALRTEGDLGGLAGLLAQVISADSSDVAETRLDGLGVARVRLDLPRMPESHGSGIDLHDQDPRDEADPEDSPDTGSDANAPANGTGDLEPSGPSHDDGVLDELAKQDGLDQFTQPQASGRQRHQSEAPDERTGAEDPDGLEERIAESEEVWKPELDSKSDSSHPTNGAGLPDAAKPRPLQDESDESEGLDGSDTTRTRMSPLYAEPKAVQQSKRQRSEPQDAWQLIVSGPGKKDASNPDDELKSKQAERRNEIGQAGVDFVMRYEREAGRIPKEMPPNHPGYDVESYDADGNLVRVIEVKSIAGNWGDGPTSFPKLTAPQFSTNWEEGEAFWLYVVEHAESDDPVLTCIPDPAGTATRFVLDPGWAERHEKIQ